MTRLHGIRIPVAALVVCAVVERLKEPILAGVVVEVEEEAFPVQGERVWDRFETAVVTRVGAIRDRVPQVRAGRVQ